SGSTLKFDPGMDKIMLTGGLAVNGGTLNLNLKGTAGSTYTIAQATSQSGAFTTVAGRPSGVSSVTFNYDGTSYTAAYVPGQTGVGSNAASLGNGGPLVENFDSLASTGTTNTNLPPGAAFSESGTNADTTYAASDGSGTGVGGNTFSYGTTGSSERAFGG